MSAGPIEFGVVESDAEREAAVALRANAIAEARWVNTVEDAQNLARDADDEGAVLLVARCEGAVVGTLRIIHDADRVARILAEHEVVLPAGGTLVVGRLVVAKPFRNRSREVTVGLYAGIVRHALETGAERAVTFVTESAVRFYRLAGFPLKFIGPPQTVTGAPRRPVLFDEEVFRVFLALATDEERAAMPETTRRP